MPVCPNCGRASDTGFAYCPHCGAALLEDQATHEERKTVTVLFCDPVGFTASPETRGGPWNGSQRLLAPSRLLANVVL